jgi:hypothetical protein
VIWLLSVVKKLVKGEMATEFVKSLRDGNKVFLAQRCLNKSGQYLTVWSTGVVVSKDSLLSRSDMKEGTGEDVL